MRTFASRAVGLALVCLVLDLRALGHVDNTGVRQQQFVYGKYYSLTSDNQVDRSINTWYLFTDADHDPTVGQWISKSVSQPVFQSASP